MKFLLYLSVGKYRTDITQGLYTIQSVPASRKILNSQQSSIPYGPRETSCVAKCIIKRGCHVVRSAELSSMRGGGGVGWNLYSAVMCRNPWSKPTYFPSNFSPEVLVYSLVAMLDFCKIVNISKMSLTILLTFIIVVFKKESLNEEKATILKHVFSKWRLLKW